MHRVLRPVVARQFSARLRIDVVAVESDQRPFFRRQADAVEVGFSHAEVVEFAHGIGLQIDADAERAHLADRLEDDGAHADLMECERGGEPANAAAGNDDAVVGQAGTHDTTPPRPFFTTGRAGRPLPTKRDLGHGVRPLARR